MPVFYPKWHKNDYQNEPCYTGVVYTESNFSPRFIDLLFSAQNTKVKKVFVLITKITGFSLPSASAVSVRVLWMLKMLVVSCAAQLPAWKAQGALGLYTYVTV